MTVGEFIVLLIVAGVLGAVTQSIFGFRVGGFFISMILGLIGGWFGSWIAQQIRLPRVIYIGVDGVGEYPVIWSILGCLIVTSVVAWMQRQKQDKDKKK
jgi:uncharacterized membrane protein YeaQ/YmgE (transglycosylase-associated protein family)